jgi:hypothetical protein
MITASKLANAAATVIFATVGVSGCGLVVAGCTGSSVEQTRPTHDRTLRFSGHTWQVRSNAVLQGPGPNYFSDSRSNVWVDNSGRLHLRLTNVNGKWYAAAVISRKSFGYGRYLFALDSPVHALDQQVVLGLFTWNTAPAYHDREIDIEFSRFGNASSPTNGDFVVQPYNLPRHLKKFVQPAVSPSTHWFDWQRGSVTFGSSSTKPSSWRYERAGVPPPSAPVRMNLWLYHGIPPTNGEPVEIVVRRFTYTPTR